MRRVYLSGPMTGIVDWNYPAFNAAAVELRELGFEVVNPAENGLAPESDWAQHMRLDVARMMECDGLVMLPGWQESKGARIEHRLAIDLGMPAAALDVVVRFQAPPMALCDLCLEAERTEHSPRVVWDGVDLKPCICGEKGHIKYAKREARLIVRYAIECLDCDRFFVGRDQRKVVELWNDEASEWVSRPKGDGVFHA